MIYYLTPILYIFIVQVEALTVDLQNICSCSELINESDCQEAVLMCTWNKNKCEEVACSNIKFQDICINQSSRCFWSSGICQDFTSCSEIEGANNEQCIYANIYCPASNGTNCGTIGQLNTCSSLNSSDTCYSYISQAGACLWTGNSCTVATSCQQIYSSPLASCAYIGCYLSANNTCLPQTCSNLQNQTSCDKGIFILGPYLQNSVPCSWSSENNLCEDFTPSNADIDQCYLKTLNTYHWSDKKTNKGSCQQCFEHLLKTIIVILLSLIV